MFHIWGRAARGRPGNASGKLDEACRAQCGPLMAMAIVDMRCASRISSKLENAPEMRERIERAG